MKRFATAAVAAATAISLSTTAAVAEDGSTPDSSSAVGKDGVPNVSPGHEASSDALSSLSENSSTENRIEGIEASSDTFKSSYENDKDQGWALGSSADLIIGTILALGAAAAVVSGAIPGLQIPNMPSF